MKFTDGYWLTREGVTPHYAAEAVSAEAGPNELRLLVATQRIRHRGDTLQGPVIDFTLSSPMPDVLRVRAVHFSGGDVDAGGFPLEVPKSGFGDAWIEDGVATFCTGAVEAKIALNKDWKVEILAGGKALSESPWRGLGVMDVQGEGPLMKEELQLAVGECVYGLGERFGAFVKNGQSVDIWNRDGGTGSDQAYKNVPFYLTNRGYGVLVNHSGNVEFEIATEKVSRAQFSVRGQVLEYFLIYGPSPKEVLAKMTALTGRPALPPAWTFGLWLTTSFTTDYDEASVTGMVEGFRSRDIPLHVFHFDCFWMRAFRWCDFTWDPEVFPDPPGMLKRLKDQGLRICVWINSYIAQKSELFDEAKKEGHLIKRPNGDVWQWDMWQPGMGIVDFTSPAAQTWFQSKLRPLVQMGVDAFKTDFGERIPTDAVFADGSNPELTHNRYSLDYNRCVFELLEQEKGIGEAAVFARSATAGSQKYPVHWGGDCYSSYESMAESLRGGLSLGLCGFGFWSHDIGGFEGMPPAHIYKRWIAFGLMSSHSRLHGSSSYRVPWLFDEEACDVLRTFVKLKCRLMPYLWSQAVQARDAGLPMMRAMVLEFPDDPTCSFLDRQYMLGESLLVAPVFDPEGWAEFYLPTGAWTSVFDGSVLEGPGWHRKQYGFEEMPLFVRPGSVIAWGKVDDRPDYDFPVYIDPRAYGLADGESSECLVHGLRGEPACRIRAEARAGEVAYAQEKLRG